jgi:hypothetical protein
MDESRKPDDEQPRAGDPPAAGEGEPTEDRAAILSRRAFLIESALASAGITVGIAGCGPSKKDTAPQVCLSVAPTECLKVAPQSRPTACLGVAPRPCLSVAPRVCLEVAPQKCLRVAPQKCLKIRPPAERRDGGVPRPCLSRPRPRVCLSIAPPTKKPSGKICLSEF